MKKHLTTIFLCFALLLNCVIPVGAIDNFNTASCSGISMTVDTFSKAYSTGDTSLTSNDFSTKSVERTNSEMEIISTSYKNGILTFVANIYDDHTYTELKAEGKLYNGHKTRNGTNSIIGDMIDKNGNFEILYFEILNDTVQERSVISRQTVNEPVLRLYLRKDNRVFLFEINIPNNLLNIKPLDSDLAPTTKDTFWFSELIPPRFEEVSITAEMLALMGISDKTRGITEETQWTNSTVYTLTYTFNGETIQVFSIPYGEWYVQNIGTSAGSIWRTNFKVAEYCMRNGSMDRSIVNPLEYTNVELQMCVGANSAIENTYINGTIRGRSPNVIKTTGDTITSKLAKYLLPVGTPSIATIRNILSALNGLDKQIKLSESETVNVFSDLSCTAYSTKLATAYYLRDNYTTNNQYYFLRCGVVKNGSACTSTNGMINQKWDVYYGGSLYTSGNVEIPFNYSVG